MKFIKHSFLFFLGLSFGFLSTAQITIKGPQCVLADIDCQYELRGTLEEDAKISICVSGGIITENSAACIDRTFLNAVNIKWAEGKKDGTITITSPSGKVTYNVAITNPLNAGVINGTKNQAIEFNKKPVTFSCSAASGGSCTPSYSYQWQRSLDKLKWINIEGQTGLNISFSSNFTETTFFRRKTVEHSSNTIIYSGEAVVYVNADMKGL